MRRRALLPCSSGLLLALLAVTALTTPLASAGWFSWGSKSNNEQEQSNGDQADTTDTESDSLARANQLGIPTGYAVGKQYNYQYDSQLASTLTGGEHFAVSRVRANVRVQVVAEDKSTGEKTLIIQAEQVQVAVDPQTSLPQQDVDPIGGRQQMVDIGDLEENGIVNIATKFQEALQLPFEAKISSTTGRVKSIRFQTPEQPWSENIKRSVANLLQVVGANNNTSGGIAGTDGWNNGKAFLPFSYKQTEKTIEGDCEVAYTVMPSGSKKSKWSKQKGAADQQRQQASNTDDDQEQQNGAGSDEKWQSDAAKKGIVTVTKAINFQKCKKRPELRYNYLRHSEDFTASNAVEAGQSPYEKEAVDVSSVYEFKVGKPSDGQLSAAAARDANDDNGNNEGSSAGVVLNAKAMSVMTADVLDSDRPALTTFAYAKMDLQSVEVKQDGEQWNSLSSLKSAVTLIHSVEQDRLHERFITEGDETYLQPATNAYPDTNKLTDIAIKVMQEMMKAAKVERNNGKPSKFLDIREEAPRHLEHFVGILRLCTQEQLKSVRRKLATLVPANKEQSWKSDKFVRDIFSDALAMACTRSSIAEFAELVKDKQISETKAARAVRQLAHCRVTSQTQLDQVWNICEGEQAKAFRPLRQSCLLTWGTMAGAMCSSNSINSTNVWEWEKRQEAAGGNDIPIHPIGGHSDSDKWASELGAYAAKDGSGKLCSKAKRKEQSEKISAIYDSAANSGDDAMAEKIVAIKSLGNMGMVASLSKLEEIARNREEETLVRVQAIDALRHIAHQAPRAVQHVCLSLFQSRAEPEEIRLTAFYQLLHSQPGMEVMNVVCDEMKSEGNQNIQAFVQTAIKEMAASRKHFDHKSARVLNAALYKLKASSAFDESAEMHSPSQLHQYAVFSSDYTSSFSTAGAKHRRAGKSVEFGAGITTTAIYGKDSAVLPKEMSMALDMLFDGRLTGDWAQITIQQQNGDAALWRLAEAIQDKKFDQVVMRTRRSSSPGDNKQQGGSRDSTSTYNPYESLKRFLKRHRPYANEAESETQADSDGSQQRAGQPKLLVSSRAYGQDVEFTVIDKRFVQHFLRNGRFDVSTLESSQNTTDNLFHHYMASLGPEYKVKLPSVVGVPIVVSKSYPTLYACEGSAKLEFAPYRSDSLHGAKFSADMQAQYAHSIVNQMEAFSPIFTAGVNTRHSHVQKLPLNFVASLGNEAQSGPNVPSLNIELRLPHKEDVLVKQLSSRTSTFKRTWPSPSTVPDKYIERSERTLYLPSIEEEHGEMHQRITCPMTGIVMETRGHWPRSVDPSLIDAHANWIVGGENVLEMRVLPSESPLAASKLHFKLAFQLTSPVTAVNFKRKLLDLFDNRRELFLDTPDQEKSLVREFIQQFSSKMNTLSKIRLSVETDKQDPQKRSALMELVAHCDKHHYICTANTKIEWKRAAARDDSISDNASGQPYQITVRGTGQLASKDMLIYVGGVPSQHVLARADFQITATDIPTPAAASMCLYGRPSALKVADWQMLLEEARRAGIGDFEYNRRSRIPIVLSANDVASVWEFQCATPSKELLRSQYAFLKSLPQSKVHVRGSLEEQLWDQDYSQQQPVKLYTRFIADEGISGGSMYSLYNVTVSDDPYSLVKAMGVRKAEHNGEHPKAKGNHLHISNQLHDEEDYDADESSFKRAQQQQKRRALSQSSRRASPFDAFTGSDSSSPAHYAECRIDAGRYVRSFDGQSYVIPLDSTCFTILAKDCDSVGSGNKRPQFEVLAKKVKGNSGNGQRERIFVQFTMDHGKATGQGPKKYELYLEQQPSQHQHPSGRSPIDAPRMIITLNGKQLSNEQELRENGFRVIDPNAGYSYSTSAKSVSGQAKRLRIYILHCAVTGAELEFDGEQLRVRLSKRFVNKQCGVCGHYNLDKADELTMIVGGSGATAGPNSGKAKQQKKLASDLREFHSNWIDKQQGVCDAEAVASRITKTSPARQQPRQQGQEQDSAEEWSDSYTFGGKKQRKTGYSKSEEGEGDAEQGWQDQNNDNVDNDATNSDDQQQADRYSNYDSNKDEEDARSIYGEAGQEFRESWEESNQAESGENIRRQESQGQKIKTVSATKVVEHSNRVCFSKRPVPTCPSGTRPSTVGAKQLKREQIDYVCLPRYAQQVRKWQRQMRERADGKQSMSGEPLARADVDRDLQALDNVQLEEVKTEQKGTWVPRECVRSY